MRKVHPANDDADRRWPDRYRDLRRRIERLEALFSDQATFDRIMASGRYFKLAATTARAYEQIEREFSWRRLTSQDEDTT
jgi:hypothetical protein